MGLNIRETLLFSVIKFSVIKGVLEGSRKIFRKVLISFVLY